MTTNPIDTKVPPKAIYSHRKRWPALDKAPDSRVMASTGPFQCRNYDRCKGWVRSYGELCPQCVSSLTRRLHVFVRLRHSLLIRSNGKISKSRDERGKLAVECLALFQ